MKLYYVRLLHEDGSSSFLRVKDRISWKTKKTAIKHAEDIYQAKLKRPSLFAGTILISVETEFEQSVKEYRFQ